MTRNALLDLFNFTINKELKEIYVSIFLRSLSFGIITIFMPLYLLKEINYNLNQVLYFFFLFSFFMIIFTPISAKLSSSFGLKHSMLVSVPFYLYFYFLLFSINEYNWSIYLLAIIFAFAGSLFWISFHTEFAKFTDRDHRGEEIGIWYILASIFSALGPLIGGLILTFFDFNFLFIIVGFLLLLSILPLFFSSEIHEPVKFSLKFMFTKFKFRDTLAAISYGIKFDFKIIILPLFIFYNLKNYLSLGALFTFSSFFIILFLIFIGKLSDISNKRKLMKIGSYIYSIGIIGILFADNWWILLILLSIVSIALSLFDVSLSAIFYDNALETRNLMEYLVLREIFICTGKIILLGLVILFNNLIFGFIITSLDFLFLIF